MVSSTDAAAFIGFWSFWVLLFAGWAWAELTLKQIIVFLALWMAGRIGLPYVPWVAAPVLFSPYVAVLDIALVFAIFGSDVRLR